MTWSVSFTVFADQRPDAYGDLLDDDALSVSLFEDPDKADPNATEMAWRVDALFEKEPDLADLSIRLTEIAVQTGQDTPDLTMASVPDIDWVTETLSTFKPMRIGRFWVHGSHDTATAPSGSIPLTVDAATAFGTGEHATTEGCLLALDTLAKLDQFRRLVGQTGRISILDVGCGTGILAMAAARCWPVNVLASDIDEEAVRVARAMVATNGLTARVNVVQSDGITQRHLLTEAPYAVITANILARPLCHMARDLTAALAPRGRLVLSGLLTTQVSMVRSAYQVCGLSLEREIPMGEWSTLVLKH